MIKDRIIVGRWPRSVTVVPAGLDAEVLLDYSQAHLWRVDCSQLGYRDRFIFELDNIPQGKVVLLRMVLFNVNADGIVPIYRTYPGWKGFLPARKGVDNLYEMRTWDGGVRIVGQRQKFI